MLIERDMTEFSCAREVRVLSEPAPQDRAPQAVPALQLQIRPSEDARSLPNHPGVVRRTWR